MRKLAGDRSLSGLSRWWSATSVKKKLFEVVFGPLIVLIAGVVITNELLSPDVPMPPVIPVADRISVVKVESIADSHKPWIRVILRNPTGDEVAVTSARLAYHEASCNLSKIPPGELYGGPIYEKGPLYPGKLFTFDINERVSAHSIDSFRIDTRQVQSELGQRCKYYFDLALIVNGESPAISVAKGIILAPLAGTRRD